MNADRAVPRRQRWLGPYSVLGSNRSLRLLFAAHVLSTLIDWLYVVALFILSYRLTHSATVVALLTLTRLLPYALLVPLSGAITDRVDQTSPHDPLRIAALFVAERAVNPTGLGPSPRQMYCYSEWLTAESPRPR
jgi:MFS family permease